MTTTRKHVLLVEDDPTLQRAMKRFLKGCVVTTTNNVVDATTLLAAVTFDAVITDYNLEGHLTGADLIHWIRTHCPPMLEKTIVFSANTDALEIHTRVIPKPHMADLASAIAAI